MTPFEYEVECPQCGAAVPMSAGDDAGVGVCPVCRARFHVAEAAGTEAAEEDAGSLPEGASAPGFFSGALSEADQMAPAVVCLAREEKVNPLAVGALLEGFLGLDRREARRQVVTGNGLLADKISLDTARRMVEALGGIGVDAFAWPEERLPPVAGQVRIARVVGAGEDALTVEVDAQGTIKTVSWPKLVAGMCLKAKFGGQVTYEPERDRAGAGALTLGGVGMMPYPSVPIRYKRATVEPKPEVLLVLRDGSGRAFLMGFRESQVRYGYLGDREHLATEQNLAELLGDIMRWAPNAFFTAGFRAMAAGKPARVTQLVGRMERDNYVRWTIACAASRGLFGAG